MSMLFRPETYEDIVGHKDLIRLMRDRVNSNTYSQFSLLYGEEGNGKTTLMKINAQALNCTSELIKPCGICESCKSILENVIRNNINTDNVYSFKMSVNGGKEAAEEVRNCMNNSFLEKRVIIMDECHGMSDVAQDALLQDLEYIPKGVFIQAATTDITRLRKAFLSRVTKWSVGRLSPNETLYLLKMEVQRRNLVLQNGDAMLQLIGSINEYKPRACLKILEQCGENTEVTMKDLQVIMAFTSVSKIIPIISSLSGSVIVGMNAIQDLSIDVNTQNSILEILTEAFKLTQGQKSTRLGHEDTMLIREAIAELKPNVLGQFLYSIASVQVLTKSYLLASYLRVHPSLSDLAEHSDQILSAENNMKINLIHKQEFEDTNELNIPSMDDITSGAEIYEE